jgi:hypothetical protein
MRTDPGSASAPELAERGPRPADALTLQARVRPWMLACFGEEIARDQLERCDRFIEEALELLQVFGYEPARIHALIDYVYGRPVGELEQEVGGTMLTLAALCLAVPGVDMHACGEAELARVWTKVDVIRAKQAAKPHGSALPIASANAPHRGVTPESSSSSPGRNLEGEIE